MALQTVIINGNGPVAGWELTAINGQKTSTSFVKFTFRLRRLREKHN
jgi:hypothetical protein